MTSVQARVLSLADSLARIDSGSGEALLLRQAVVELMNLRAQRDRLRDAPIRPKQFLAWAVETFGPVALDQDERTARFVEEALELAHAEGLPADIVARIFARVFSRPRGDRNREIGQALATLECLAENIGVSAEAEAQREWERVQSIPKAEWTKRHADKSALGIANLSEGS